MATIEQMNQQIEAFEKKVADLKKKRGKEITRFRYQKKKEQLSAVKTWGIALEKKLKNENDLNKRNEIRAYLESAMKEMTSKTKKSQNNITDAIEYLNQLMTETEPTTQEKQPHE
jgi:hypothetical protein